MDIFVITMLSLEALFALWLLRRAGVLKGTANTALCILLLAAAFTLRGLVFGYETLDYQNFLSPWTEFFRSHGRFAALKYSVGNYNIPYLYFLALFSCLPVKDLYLIKLLSVFFDVVLAWSSMQLMGKYIDSVPRRLGCFFTVMFLPTVFLNGALWGQCDSIYVAFAVLSIYLALDDRPVLSMVCMAVSFGFKLQAVFVMPVTAVLYFRGKYKLRHFLVFPAVYVLLVLPAVLIGRPFIDTLTLYFSQTGSIGSGLNYNSPSIFAFIGNVSNTELASKAAIAGAAVYMFAVLAAAFILRKKQDNRAVLAAAVLFAIGIPFLLPHMHDRYFFAADVLTVVLAFSAPECFTAAIMVQFASLLGYHAYLKMRYLLPMNCGSVALSAAILLTFSYFFGVSSGLSKEKN